MGAELGAEVGDGLTGRRRRIVGVFAWKRSAGTMHQVSISDSALKADSPVTLAFAWNLAPRGTLAAAFVTGLAGFSNRIGNNSHNAEIHRTIQVAFELTQSDAESVGFYSTSHRGIFIPMDSTIPMHFQTLDNKFSRLSRPLRSVARRC